VRDAFISTLFEAAKKDDRLMLVVGDIGFGVVTRFMNELPQQFVNAGIAEQNMAGMAAGLALSGRIVFTYSIANFPTLRAYEQIRNDIAYHHCNVKVVAVGGGFAYGALGASHHATEDIAVMRAIPNMTVFAPNDPVEAELTTLAAINMQGPVYLRLGRSGESAIHATAPPFVVGRAIPLREGRDATLIVSAGMAKAVLEAADILSGRGRSFRILSMPTVKPLDAESVIRAARDTPAIFTVEEHSVIGGIGSAVAECLLESPHRPKLFRRIGIADVFVNKIGDQAFLREAHGLSPTGIAAAVESVLSHA